MAYGISDIMRSDPIGPGDQGAGATEIATVGSMLDAFAQRKRAILQKNIENEQARLTHESLARYQLGQLANGRATNRNTADKNAETGRHNLVDEGLRGATEARNQHIFELSTAEKVAAAAAANKYEVGRNIASAGGFGPPAPPADDPDAMPAAAPPPQKAPPPPPPPAPAGAPAGQGDPTFQVVPGRPPLVSDLPQSSHIPDMGPPVQAAPQGRAAVTPPPQVDPGVSMHLPGGRNLLFTEKANSESETFLARQADALLAEMAPAADTPVKQESLRDIRGLVLRRQLPPDKDSVAKAYLDLVSKREGHAAQVEAAKTRATDPLKRDGATRMELGKLDQALNQWRGAADWRPLISGGRTMRATAANLISDDPNDALKHKDAMVQLARYFRGGMPTEGEMHLLYNDLGGKLGNAAPKLYERWATGDITDTELAMVRESAKVAHDEWKHNVGLAMQSARTSFGPGSGWENYAAPVNKRVRGLFQVMGLDDADIQDVYEGVSEDSGPRIGARMGNAPVRQAPPGGASPAQAVRPGADPASGAPGAEQPPMTQLEMELAAARAWEKNHAAKKGAVPSGR